ncbi:MAG: YafY family transcriptional regulator [candidate division Zixibacteria bacterium]|nr:YafY family transcriptional regulator [candidate division Zixibacteria bacterium]
MSKYDRLIHVLNLLRSRKSLRTADIAKECEVSERTVYRDILALSSANVPIYFDDGYKLLSDAFLPPLNFDLEEYLILRLGLTASPLCKDSPLGKSAKKLLAKIDAGLPSGLKDQKSKVDPSLEIDLKCTAEFCKLSLIFGLIEQSILHHRMIRITYDSLESGIAVREVDPYCLVFRRHAWYMIGFCHKRNEFRTFRLNRIKKVALLDRNFEKSKDFVLSDFLKHSWEIYCGEPVEVKVEFKGKAARLVTEGKYHSSEKIENRKDGKVLYSATVAGTEEITRWILGFGEEATVLEPKELKDEIVNILDKTKVNYQRNAK